MASNPYHSLNVLSDGTSVADKLFQRDVAEVYVSTMRAGVILPVETINYIATTYRDQGEDYSAENSIHILTQLKDKTDRLGLDFSDKIQDQIDLNQTVLARRLGLDNGPSTLQAATLPEKVAATVDQDEIDTMYAAAK